MIYCYQRPCELRYTVYSPSVNTANALEAVTKATPPITLTTSLSLARSGRISPDGRKVVFIGRSSPLESHNGCFELYSVELPASTASQTLAPRKILSLVNSPVGDLPSDLPEKDLHNLTVSLCTTVFPGVFTDQLPKHCFSSDGSKVYFNTQWGVCTVAVCVELATSQVQRLTKLTSIISPSGSEDTTVSTSILDINGDHMVFATSSPLTPPRIGMLSLSSNQLWRTTTAPKFYSLASKYQFNRLNKITKNGREEKDSAAAAAAADDDDDDHHHAKEYENMNVADKLIGMKYKIITTVEMGIPFQSILILPPSAMTNDKIPMIVSPHGGKFIFTIIQKQK